jgi:RsiW-degrading membrane proteinase PrsW (M82 family)
MFHITFTLWMLWNGPSDLIEHGTFFSMMVIYLMNFLVLSLMLVLASRDVTFVSFGRELLAGAMDFSDSAMKLVGLK